jgi:hypothetical protein
MRARAVLPADRPHRRGQDKAFGLMLDEGLSIWA